MDDQNEPIVRTRMFVLLDGVFVVKWDDTMVQELLTGKYRKFDRREFGAYITDYELNQLRQAGVVQRFDREQVWLSPAMERSRYYQSQVQTRVRAYYLNTTFAAVQRDSIEDSILELGLDDVLDVRLRDDFVVIFAENGRAFGSFDEAENARQQLVETLPAVFGETVVAFVETTRRDL
jgi:hypothetical protein